MALAFLVDGSGLGQGPEGWGYVFAAASVVLVLAPLPLVLALMAAVGGSPRGDDLIRRQVCAWVGAAVAALSGLVLGALGVASIAGGSDAGLAWGLGEVLIAVPLFLPLTMCARAGS